MFWEVIETKYDNNNNPEKTEQIVGRFQNFVRASYFAKDYFDKNKPKDFKTIIEKDYYGECFFIAEKLNNSKRVQQYMIEAREVRFDD